MAVRVTIKPQPDPLTTGTHYRIQVGSRDCLPDGPWLEVHWAADDRERDEIVRHLKVSGERRKIVVTPMAPLPEDDGLSVTGTIEVGHVAPRPRPRVHSKHIVLENSQPNADPFEVARKAITRFEERRDQRRAASQVHARYIQRRARGKRARVARAQKALASRTKLDDRIVAEHQKWTAWCKKTGANRFSRNAFCKWLANRLLGRGHKGWLRCVTLFDQRRVAAGEKPICSR